MICAKPSTSLLDIYTDSFTHDTLLRREVLPRWYVLLCPSLSLSRHMLTCTQLEKYKKAEFGKCPRVNCLHHPLLPMGLSDIPNVKPVKLYCARCEDMYNPKSGRHASIDGAYFGTSFHNIIFQVYPALIPAKSLERYVPCVFGFKVHAAATLVRWQAAQRDEMRKRLMAAGVEAKFRDDDDREILEKEFQKEQAALQKGE